MYLSISFSAIKVMLSNLITKVENLLRQSIIHLLMALAKKKIGKGGLVYFSLKAPIVSNESRNPCFIVQQDRKSYILQPSSHPPSEIEGLFPRYS